MKLRIEQQFHNALRAARSPSEVLPTVQGVRAVNGASTPEVPTEYTTTVVIGSGLPGLAVAGELSRRGVSAIVVEGLLAQPPGPSRSPLPDSSDRGERNDLLRLLQAYATSHEL